jgi:hypothetical protein
LCKGVENENENKNARIQEINNKGNLPDYNTKNGT